MPSDWDFVPEPLRGLMPGHGLLILDLADDAIVSIDQNQNIILFNQGAEKTFGYSGSEVLGKPLDILLPSPLAAVHRQHISEFVTSPVRARRMGERRQIVGIRKDGSEFPAEATISKALLEGRLVLTVILRDITERRLADEKIRASLEEKEALLKEIHHRVKNNLQVISSLLGLQARTGKNDQVRKSFEESQNRIHSMALLHETLYQSGNLSRIDCARYFEQLSSHLFRCYGVSATRIALILDVLDVKLGLESAVPCGLIVNELISNSLKHAFPDGRNGEILIRMRAGEDRQMCLVVADSGVGLPENIGFWTTRSLGLRLVRTLADQLHATVQLNSNRGTEVKLTFPASQEEFSL